jgi:hypothetical protein
VNLIKTVEHDRCHLIPTFFYMSTVGLIWSKFCVIAFQFLQIHEHCHLSYNFCLICLALSQKKFLQGHISWHTEKKIITALSSALTFLSHEGLNRQMLWKVPVEEAGEVQTALQLWGIEAVSCGVRLRRNPGHNSGIRNKLK